MQSAKSITHFLHIGCSILFFLGLVTLTLNAQSRQDLTKKRQRLILEINQANELLSTTKKDKKAALNQYYTIQRQIRQREQLIETLEQEIVLSDKSIDRTSGTINDLQADMDRLEAEYGEMARQAYRSKMSDNKWFFLFSADGISDGLKRWRYIQQYDEYRKKQASLIIETRASLTEKLTGIEIKKAEQQDLLAVAQRQQDLLEKELRVKNGLLKDLKKDESRISKLINRKRKAHRQLSTAIENIISKEIRSRVGVDRVNAAPRPKSSPSNNKPAANTKETPPAPSISTIAKSTVDFSRQKGKLLWPVQNGIVTRHFGKQKHPIHKQIEITNNGIDIRAKTNNKVSAIFHGQVAGFQYVPGYQNTLIIQHGNYYSVYSNMEKVIVKKGETVRAGQLLGVAGRDAQDSYLEVHLEIWKGKKRLNPAVWLGR